MKPVEDQVELETQFIMRLPEEPAKILHEAIQSGSNIKDRLSIKLDQEVRYGEVRLDHYLLHAKVLDLPTVIESLKTIDNKSFYKTADICQIMICKEEPDDPQEEESPNKAKKKDHNKVDKKFLFPHGVTAPCKNVRKRRFRKTLKKKYVEAPEIEKEVKRLLRIDNDAVSVKYEIIQEDEETSKNDQQDESKQAGQHETDDDKHDDSKEENKDKRSNKGDSDDEDDHDTSMNQFTSRGLAEEDIFGGEVSSSSSDEDETRQSMMRNRDIHESSRLSADDSRMSEFSVGGNDRNNYESQDINPNEEDSSRLSKNILTEFDKAMFSDMKDNSTIMEEGGASGHNDAAMSSEFFNEQHQQQQQKELDSDYDESSQQPQMSKDEIKNKILDLREECDDLKIQTNQKQNEISSIQNPLLKQRLQETVDNLLSDIVEKELQIQEYQNMLQKVAASSD